MKKEVLDIPFKDNFSDVLKKDEKILWRGSPKKEVALFYQKKIEFIIPFLFIIGAIFIELYSLNRFPFIACLITLSLVLSYFRKEVIQETEYLITQERILFNLPYIIKNKIHQISFTEINNCIVIVGRKDLGTIFLDVKNPKAITFETYKNNEIEVRAQPTLELIENPEEVTRIIRQAIRST